MKAKIIPFELGKSLAVGDPRERDKLKGPILFVPERGAVFYKCSFRGDCDRIGLVTIGVDYFESHPIILKCIASQIQGKNLLPGYRGEKFDLSAGVMDVEISEEEFDLIANEARLAYSHLYSFECRAMRFMHDLEAKVGGIY